jgi:hypothetical protein
MATRADVGRKILEISTKVARKIDEAPTGVKPGYRPGLKGTVLSNGRLIDASDTPASGTRIWTALKNTTQALPGNTRTVVNFNAITLDPPDNSPADTHFVTGSSWAFTPDNNGDLMIVGLRVIVGSGGVDWVEGDGVTLEFGVSGATAFTNLVAIDDYTFTAAATSTMAVWLHGLAMIGADTIESSYAAYVTLSGADDREILNPNVANHARFWAMRLSGAFDFFDA